MQSVARPSTAGLRGAYSEGNLTDLEMYGTGVEGLRGMGGSAPWLVNNKSTRLNAAQNKYLQSNSSIFGDDSGHHAIKVQRSRQTMQDLQKQMTEREEAKRWAEAEEQRLYAAMNVSTAANPSPGRMRDTADIVEDTGSFYGGYEGYGGSGGAYSTGGYGGGGGGAGAGYVPSVYGNYGAPRRPPRAHVSMTSDEVDVMRAEAAEQLRGDLQWQVQMKRQLEEERRQKEALEDRLVEENARQQQERMQREYQAELDQRRRKEEEQTKRRDAQLRQMELVQQRVEAEKREKMERARKLADLSEKTALPPQREDFGTDAKVIKPAGGADGGKGSKGPDRDEFDFDALKSDSAFLAAQKPNKFFDSPSMPVKVPTNTDIRKRPKPLTPATEAPRKANNRPTLAVPRLRKAQPNRPRTTLAIGGMMDTPAQPAGGQPPDAGPATLAVPPPRPHPGTMTLAPPAGLGDGWPPRAPPQASQPSLTQLYQKSPRQPAAPFDWRIRVEEPSQEEKRRLEQMSQKEIDQFQERNTDVMSQLTAMKTDLKTPRGGRDGRDGDRDSGYVPSHAQDPTRLTPGGETVPSVVPSGDKGEVDVMRVPTAKELPHKDTGNEGTFNPDDTSRTILRKFMEKKKRQ
ncbi:MAP7 domain-containing protein 2-like isoform X2 [Scylla paramamosain]|uniref:MAP7 domain-containing protein 2-like isoform X2 n=1 Tax=Scylla paramamosain TaxID=85552 RepID=UPI00308291E9